VGKLLIFPKAKRFSQNDGSMLTRANPTLAANYLLKPALV